MEGKNLSKEQMNVENAKFQLPFGAEHISRKIELPVRYGKDRIIAMTRDPWWIFTYWEITSQREKEIRQELERNGEHFEKSVLRIYDITGMPDFKPGKQNSSFDITIKDLAKNWYVDVSALARRWCIEIGLLSREGNFYALARSNIIHTPRFGMSDIFDEAWMLSEEEYWWLFGASGGFDVGKSSLEMKELFLRQLKEWISSGGLISLGSFVLQKK